MFLSIATTHQPATDLGYLLHKHPDRLYETALNFGHEALKRFVARQPLRRVHECVFAVLALESEPIDPRL